MSCMLHQRYVLPVSACTSPQSTQTLVQISPAVDKAVNQAEKELGMRCLYTVAEIYTGKPHRLG